MAMIAAIQMTSEPDVDANFRQIRKALQGMEFEQPCLVVLPECFAWFGASDKSTLEQAEPFGEGVIQQRLIELAREFNIWLVSGTIPLRGEEPEKFTASSLVIDNHGQVIAHYQKIHMFDVEVADNTRSYKESRYTQAGNEVCVVPGTPFGTLGVAVCYDLRFPGLFDAMGEVDVLALPAAFTQKTGKAHWQPLLQARSIENQCYLVAANQSGVHANGRETWGHSCIYSPWGELLMETLESPGFIYSDVNFSYLEQIRATMPVKQQNRFRSKLV
ncbi:carbon-nitrogen hydrolase family protein [Planctobacterium marinum]|uniref:Beta-ureidopropionase n=1 Tax=Planctobacterium marinum TaxID=1631968 RepID=A0AA48HSW6_9ALTE|nr:beta-ureidopropionase [Planctobacterium marinum]